MKLILFVFIGMILGLSDNFPKPVELQLNFLAAGMLIVLIMWVIEEELGKNDDRLE